MSAQERAKSAAAEEKTTSEASGLLDTILSKGMRARDDDARQRGRESAWKPSSSNCSIPSMIVAKDTEKTINLRIAEIDRMLSAQLNEIMHTPSSRSWKAPGAGCTTWCTRPRPARELKIRVLNVSKKDLLKDLERASSSTRARCSRRSTRRSTAARRRAATACWWATTSSAAHPEDIGPAGEDLQRGRRGPRAVLSAAPPELFDMESFTELSQPRDLAKIFETRRVRQVEIVPRVGRFALRRPDAAARRWRGCPTATRPCRSRSSTSRKTSTARDHDKYSVDERRLGLRAPAHRRVRQVRLVGPIRGVEGGGKVEGLPVHTFPTDDGDVAMKCPTEIAITDRREYELSNLGFMPLCHCKDTDFAVFIGAQSLPEAEGLRPGDANANAELSTKLHTSCARPRFAHYLKVMARDKIGSFMEAQRVRGLAERLDQQLRASRTRERRRRDQGQAPAARGQDRGARSQGQAGLVRGRGLPAAALPAGELERLAAAGGRGAGIEGINDQFPGNSARYPRSGILAGSRPEKTFSNFRQLISAGHDNRTIRENWAIAARKTDSEHRTKNRIYGGLCHGC